MDRGNFKKLNGYHVVFLVQNVLIGMQFLSLPSDLSDAGYSLWMIPIVLGIFVQITLYPMIKLCLKYPDKNIFEVNEILLGKWLGKSVTIIFTVYLLISSAAVCDGYLRLVQTITLSEKSLLLPLIALIGVATYIVLGGIKTIARFCIFTFVWSAFLMYFLQWPLEKSHYTHILPLLQLTPSEGLTAFWNGLYAIAGFELILIYFPYIINQKKALRHASIGLWITIFFYVSVCLVSVLYFSPWQLKHLIYPILNLFKSVELTFIERIENFGINFWVFLILSTLSAYLWSLKKAADNLLMKNRVLHLYMGLTLVIFLVIGPIPLTLKQLIFNDVPLYLALFIMLYPVLLLLLHRIRNGRRKSHDTQKHD